MKIGFLIIPNMLVTSFSNAFELFAAAKAKAIAERSLAAKTLELLTIQAQEGSKPLHSGLQIQADMVLTSKNGKSAPLPYFDMIFVPTMWRNPNKIVNKNKHIGDWLRDQWEHGAIINATGTGVCFVAESGLLDQQAATTHWYHFDEFEKKYPAVNLKRHHFITSSRKIFCAASINAQTDLVLHHVHRFIGPSVSEHLSRHFSHEVRQPYDRLSFDQEKENSHPDESILQAQLWLQNNLNQAQLSLESLPLQLGMSSRTFNRRFKLATGTSPKQYLQAQRLIEAKDLLKKSNLSIGEIAFRVGYLDVSYFSKLFKSDVGASPTQWRTSIRAKLFND